jgi:murein DD-endopeptidase MepM/ murein hydrolase activator NlpD
MRQAGAAVACTLCWLALTTLAGSWIGAAQAGDAPVFKGRWLQGAPMLGSVAPGSRLEFGGREVSVSKDGRFVIGIAYDAPPAAELTVIDPAGAVHRQEYSVEPRVYDVQKIGGLPKGMVEPPAAVQRRIEAEQALVAGARTFDTPIDDFANAFIWPVPAEVTGVYGSNRILNGVPKQPHFGIDLAAPEGAPVRAAAGGIVRLAQRDLYYTGGTIILDHGRGLTTTYLHLSRVDVKPGQDVRQGAVIGRVGKTGRATGPHLCWRATWFDVRLDASLLLQPEPAQKGETKK